MVLLESEFFSNNSSLNSSSAVWREFRLWTYFQKIPDFNKCFHHHCRRLWSKVNHAHREAQKKMQEVYNISEAFGRPKNYKLDIAEKTTRDVATVDFFDLVKPTSEEDTIAVVNKYYSHNLNKDNKLHRSKEFKKGLVEHFGAFTGNNNEPYTTANTASNHCSEHRKYVRELISRLQPLSNAVNSYLQETYPALYAKMAKLNLGPNVPKPLKYALCSVPTWKIQRWAISVSRIKNKDPDNSDSEIDIGMNNNKKLRHQKNALRRIKNDQKPQSQAHDYERLKIQDEAISVSIIAIL
ncbi:hypothetical protein C2G38_2250790 [Gigaspora rosea]|uniref:Uncharacterized protein n=1 Tax=Gigaspora rosea TaxID=44941 RepID=A0A397UNX5_9GLOM|nr:hypothetical protein C2G38_2250790 [Gigaspora rosea]